MSATWADLEEATWADLEAATNADHWTVMVSTPQDFEVLIRCQGTWFDAKGRCQADKPSERAATAFEARAFRVDGDHTAHEVRWILGQPLAHVKGPAADDGDEQVLAGRRLLWGRIDKTTMASRKAKVGEDTCAHRPIWVRTSSERIRSIDVPCPRNPELKKLHKALEPSGRRDAWQAELRVDEILHHDEHGNWYVADELLRGFEARKDGK